MPLDAQALLAPVIAHVSPPDSEFPFRQHLDRLTKPLSSLGRLEDFASQLGSLRIERLHKAVYVFAADHGIATAGVSAYPQAVTAQMVRNFLAGGAAINVLARLHGAAVHIVNAGVASELSANAFNFRNTPVRPGSRNMLDEPAMSGPELAAALQLGLDCAGEAESLGYNLVAVGEMGIGNTSAASAITSALTHTPIALVTGRGTGLDDDAHARKIAVLERVLSARMSEVTGPLEILASVGGLEIAAMTGFIVGCAAVRSAVILDGFISSAAGAVALEVAPQLRRWLFAAHRSQEPGHRILLEHMRLRPILDLDMRLGEGTGAVLAMPILESAMALYQQMASFDSAGVATASAP